MDICGGRLQRPKHQRLVSALVAVAAWAAPLGVAQSAGADADTPAQSAPDASSEAAATDAGQHDGSAGGVEVVRYAGSDPYELSIKVAQALVDAGDGSSEWVVLASGESWADAATAGPLAASLDAPVLLVPSGGLQSATARPDLVTFLKSSGVRRVVIVGGSEVLPNHEPSVLFGLGLLPRNIERIHGDDPIGVSIAAAERLDAPAELGDLGRTVIVSSDQSIADAVAVGPLAAAGPFPLLLTAPAELDPRIAAYLTEHDIEHVVLVGGTSAIAPDVQEAIESAGTTVTRLAGRDRSHTARLAADLFERHAASNPACAEGPTRIGLVPAQHPEQALTAGPPLAVRCTPLRYTESHQLPADLRNTLYLASHSPDGADVAAFAAAARLPDAILEPSVPPALVAFSGGWPRGHPRHGQTAVAIVDELGRWRHYPIGTDLNSGYLGDIFVWSPDGRFLAYVDAWLDNPQLVVIDTLSDEVTVADINAPDAQFSSWHRPVWSPDSTQLAFSAFPGDASTHASWDMGSDDGPYIYPTAEMYVYDTRTGETTRLTHNATSDEPHAWSPDSKSVAFTQAEVDIGFFGIVWYSTSLRVLQLATGAVAELYGHAQASPDVRWAPDGSHIAFEGYWNPWTSYEETRVFLARSDGSAVEELTSESNWGHVIGWTADSSEFHYLSHPPSFSYWSDQDRQYRVRNVESGKDRAWTESDSASTGDLVATGWVDDSDRSPRIRGLQDGKHRQTVTIERDRLVVHSASESYEPVIIGFPDLLVDSDGSPTCLVTWTDAGIRGSCEHWRDF